MMTGWICPKCRRVYAPMCQQCLFCNDNIQTKEASCLPLHEQQMQKYKYEPTTNAALPVFCDYCHKDCSYAYHTTGSRIDGTHWNICIDCWNERLRKKEKDETK